MKIQFPLTPPVNIRDLGGLPVQGGKVVKHRAVRSDDITTVPAELAEKWAKAGLRATIDLRSTPEREMTGAGALGELGVNSYHLPLTESVDVPEWVLGATPDIWADATGRWYASLVEAYAPRIVEALGIISDADGAVIFHCTAGKDRTGILAAMLLSILGADDEVIIEDYAATRENIDAVNIRSHALISQLFSGGPDRKLDRAHPMMGADPGSMAAMLRTLRADHGEVIAPLRDVGLSDSLVADLRRLID